MPELNTRTNEFNNEPQTPTGIELFSEDEIMIAVLDERQKATILRFLDRQLRASEHHYLEHSDQFSLGYLEAMQDVYSQWHSITGKAQKAAAILFPVTSKASSRRW
ncbi:hypothetical protein ABH994_000557 [Bradyrhizobium yuanmingense]|uniref:hypothetical protein n=1 Tax=Bradyrhizobium yuanmingense TaxID=108015 RepID=UPI0035187B69